MKKHTPFCILIYPNCITSLVFIFILVPIFCIYLTWATYLSQYVYNLKTSSIKIKVPWQLSFLLFIFEKFMPLRHIYILITQIVLFKWIDAYYINGLTIISNLCGSLKIFQFFKSMIIALAYSIGKFYYSQTHL